MSDARARVRLPFRYRRTMHGILLVDEQHGRIAHEMTLPRQHDARENGYFTKMHAKPQDAAAIIGQKSQPDAPA